MSCKYKLPLTMLVVMGMMSGCNVKPTKPDFDQYQPVYPTMAEQKPISNGSIYQGQTSSYIFEDIKARNVGDILTIILLEKTAATKKATTTTKKENTTDFGVPSIMGGPVTLNGRNLLSTDIESSQEFTGEGESEQSNALNGTITVTIANVFPNGNLFVRGQKRMLLNQGEEYIQISGIVRPQDIKTNNTVASTALADARITYSGQGSVADANKMGWLARFFNSQYWPF